MKAHLELPSFPQKLFDEWLKLFEMSLDRVFTEENKAIILQKAQMIAQNFQRVLYAERWKALLSKIFKFFSSLTVCFFFFFG